MRVHERLSYLEIDGRYETSGEALDLAREILEAAVDERVQA